MAQHLFFTLNCTGHYFCNEYYAVSHAAYDSFLIPYIRRPQERLLLFGQSAGRTACRLLGNFGLLSASTLWYGQQLEIYWIHFDGRMVRDYYEAIVQSRCQVILPRNVYHAVHALERIYNMFHVDKRINEALISKNGRRC